MNTDEKISEMQKEIKNLKTLCSEMDKQLNQGRNFLMSHPYEEAKIQDTLEAFGFGRNGLNTYYQSDPG